MWTEAKVMLPLSARYSFGCNKDIHIAQTGTRCRPSVQVKHSRLPAKLEMMGPPSAHSAIRTVFSNLWPSELSGRQTVENLH